jgi:S-adenosylmethionine synthetase
VSECSTGAITECSQFQVDMSKIKLDVIKPWIQDKLTEILKIDDDVVVDFVYNQLDEKVNNYLKLKNACLNIYF